MADFDLNFRQRMFVEKYLGECNGNATEAARLAGYASPNVQSARLLDNVSIKAAIDARVSEAAMTANEVLARLSDQASADISDFVDVRFPGEFTIDLVKAKEMGKLHLIKKIVPTKYGISIELHDSQAALAQLGRYHKLFVDRHEHNFSQMTDEDLIEEATGCFGRNGTPGPRSSGNDRFS
jgi:hypothetical protein